MHAPGFSYVRTYMVYRCRVVRLINRRQSIPPDVLLKSVERTRNARRTHPSFARNGAREL